MLVTGRAGVPLVIELFRQLGVAQAIETQVAAKQRQRGLPPSQLVKSLVALWASGGDRCQDLAMLREDQALATLQGHPLPAATTVAYDGTRGAQSVPRGPCPGGAREPARVATGRGQLAPRGHGDRRAGRQCTLRDRRPPVVRGVPVPCGARPEASGPALRRWQPRSLLRRGHASRRERVGPPAVAPREGRHGGACAARPQDRVGGRRAPERKGRGQRRLVPAERAHLQPAHRPQAVDATRRSPDRPPKRLRFLLFHTVGKVVAHARPFPRRYHTFSPTGTKLASL